MFGEKHYFRSFDGERLYYHVAGEGPPILLVNGFVCTTQYWPLMVEHFKRCATVITWDYRGHGDNPPPRDLETSNIPAAVRDMKALLDHFGCTEVILMGHSMGSQVIFEFAKNYPEWVRALISICGSCESPFRTKNGLPTPQQILLSKLVQAAKPFPGLSAFVLKPLLKTQLTIELTYLLGANRKLIDRSYIDALFDHVVSLDFAVATRFLESMLQHSARDALEHIQAPTLLIGGTKDALVTPRTIRAIQREIPFAEARFYAECSHLAMVEKHAEVMHDIQYFLQIHKLL